MSTRHTKWWRNNIYVFLFFLFSCSCAFATFFDLILLDGQPTHRICFIFLHSVRFHRVRLCVALRFECAMFMYLCFNTLKCFHSFARVFTHSIKCWFNSFIRLESRRKILPAAGMVFVLLITSIFMVMRFSFTISFQEKYSDKFKFATTVFRRCYRWW